MADRPNPISTFQAKRAYKAFTGHEPTQEKVARLDSKNVAGYRLGPMVGVAYEATRDGKTDQYFHRFKQKARPDLVSRSDGKQLYITGGDYKVTDRGIEDMPALYVVNPSKRRRRAKSGARAKSPIAFLSNPKRRKRRAPRRRAARNVYMSNPKRRRSRSRRPRRISYRRNPIGMRGGKGGFDIGSMVMPAAMVGAGAVGTEILMGYLTVLPAILKTGPQRYVTKGVIGVIAGYFLGKYVNRKAGEAFAAGAIAIATHDAIKSAVTTYAPSVPFGGYNWNKYGYRGNPAMNSMRSPSIGYVNAGRTMGQYMRPNMGEYMGGGAVMTDDLYHPTNAFPQSG